MDSSKPLLNLAASIFKSRRHGGSFIASSHNEQQAILAETVKSERDADRKNTVRIEKDKSVKFDIHDHEKLLLVRKRS